MDKLRSILLGIGVTTLAAAILGGGALSGLVWLDSASQARGFAVLILSPLLIPAALGSIALGFWISHRDDRRRLAVRPN